MKCQNCGTILGNNIKFCSECGSPVNIMNGNISAFNQQNQNQIEKQNNFVKEEPINSFVYSGQVNNEQVNTNNLSESNSYSQLNNNAGEYNSQNNFSNHQMNTNDLLQSDNYNSNQINNGIGEYNSANNFNNQTSINSNNTDDELLMEFIGKNYDKITKKQFNFAGFFFGSIYMFYRKMFLYGTILMLLNFVITNLIDNFLVTIAIDIAVGFFVNKIYLYYSSKKIEQIKNQNKSNPYAIKNECKNKGGTSAGYVFLAILMQIIIIIVAGIIGISSGIAKWLSSGEISININDTIIDENNNNNNNNNNEVIDKNSFSITCFENSIFMKEKFVYNFDNNRVKSISFTFEGKNAGSDNSNLSEDDLGKIFMFLGLYELEEYKGYTGFIFDDNDYSGDDNEDFKLYISANFNEINNQNLKNKLDDFFMISKDASTIKSTYIDSGYTCK